MKKILLSFVVALTSVVGLQAQTFEWGTATWNIQDGKVYENINELNQEGIVLSYGNPADYTLTFLNIIAVDYDLYVDDADEPIKANATAQASTDVVFNYSFVEGHKYKIVTTGALLAQANLATFKTDTVSQNSDSYTISFSIKGPDLVNTIDVDAKMALTIVNQVEQPTFSLINVEGILNDLDITSINEATIYGLNPNGSYNSYYSIHYDGWRDADGGFTLYNGGWDAIASHNAYPAVYSIKLNETADSVFYYFYDYWTVYDPTQPDTIGSSTTGSRRFKAPETSYHSIVWEWDNGDGTTTTYLRRYRTDEGKDYKASFAIVANRKYVVINATLHFVSQEDYAAGIIRPQADQCTEADKKIIYGLDGMRKNGLQKGLNLIKSSNGDIRKVLIK